MTALLYIKIVYINCIWESVPALIKDVKKQHTILRSMGFFYSVGPERTQSELCGHICYLVITKKINNLNLTISHQKPVLTYQMTLSNKIKTTIHTHTSWSPEWEPLLISKRGKQQSLQKFIWINIYSTETLQV